jgi:glycine/D-amino acid oxidase-like deaminating enzyme
MARIYVKNEETVIGCWFLAGLRGTIFRINPPITNNQRPTTVYPQSLDNVPVWDDRTWRTLAPLDSDLSTEVCVIGLGGSGLTAVSELLDLGRRVVGIDADDVAAGAAGRNGGFLLGGTVDFHHDAVAAIGRARALRLHELTLEEIHRIAGQAPGTVRFPGSLRIAGSDEEFTDCARQRDAMRADGILVEPTAFVQQYLESVLREQLDVTAPITHRWAANVSYTLNGLPVLAELRPGTWVIGGYCGTGNAVGALCGRAAARLASGDSSEFARLLVNAGTPETH